MTLHYIRRGRGRPLLLIHGLGGSWRSWQTILGPLAAAREVIAVDLPGHGSSPSLVGKPSVGALVDALIEFLEAEDLVGVDVVGSSIGGRLALELARRGKVGAVVALGPAGFWSGPERTLFGLMLALSNTLVRMLRPFHLPLARSSVGRMLLFAPFTPRPWSLSPKLVFDELTTRASTTDFSALLRELASERADGGMLEGDAVAPIIIGWGGRDVLCFPRQAASVMRRFPDADVCWFDEAGHYPHWDAPGQAVRIILSSTERAREERLSA